MSAGILTLTSNSDVVTGLDTKFTTELTAGDFIVVTTGGVTYTLPAKTIMSDTDLTLARNYNGPSASGLAWTAVPRDTLNRISAQIAADTAYIIRQRVLEVDNWYQLLEVNGIITIKMADGSSYTGPSWLKLIDVMKTMKVDELIPLVDQVHADAIQVAADKSDVGSKATQVSADAAQVASDKISSQEWALTAKEKAGEASDSAASAKNDADRAQGANPDNQLKKAQNLADLPNKEQAWDNIKPTGPTRLAAEPVNAMDASTKGYVDGQADMEFIRGLDIFVSSANFTVSPGALYLPASAKRISNTAIQTIVLSSLATGTTYHIYAFDNAGTFGIEYSATVPVRYGVKASIKTGDNTRRYLGSFHVSGGGVVCSVFLQNGRATHNFGWADTGRVLSNGKATTSTSVAFGQFVPQETGKTVILATTNGSSNVTASIGVISGVDMFSAQLNFDKSVLELPIPNGPTLYYRFGGTPATAGLYIDIGGYTYDR